MTTGLPSPDLPVSDTASQPDEPPVSIPKTSAATLPSNDLKASDPAAGGSQMATSDSAAGTPAEKVQKTGADVRTKISNLLKDKEQEWAAVVKHSRPLGLLDLPLDVLKEIVKEVTHTNDLTALALTHSALHNIAIPHIYSRFDIVWPDAHATTDPRTGVDALTYGLATLCMGDIFTHTPHTQSVACLNCGTRNFTECNHDLEAVPRNGQQRLGNQYPQFTRKFSLGNGPADWVQEYLITKESGKMLGTLVALAVARMVNLETFVWDMPTGVLRDVWLALSSLQSRDINQECRLERVWVRWHDNSEQAHLPAPQGSNTTSNSATAGSTMTSIGWSVPPGSLPNLDHTRPLVYSQSRVEYPTLSVLPPLKSLSVLDVDELDYLDEMSVLIAKSKDCLRELRVGISSKAANRDFALAWDGPDLQQVDHKAQWPGASTIGDRRLGGVLGILVGRVFDIRKKQKAKVEKAESTSPVASNVAPQETAVEGPQHVQLQTPQPSIAEVLPNGTSSEETIQESLENEPVEWSSPGRESAMPIGNTAVTPSVTFNIEGGPASSNSDGVTSNHPVESTSTLESSQSNIEPIAALVLSTNEAPSDIGGEGAPAEPELTTIEPPLRRSQSHGRKQLQSAGIQSSKRARLGGKLRLQTLELERIPLSVAVLQKAFDWSVLTNLTILDCCQHDKLWLMLRRHFQPTQFGGSHTAAKHDAGASLQYHLNLKKIHTDAASPALISFLKETLAPNTLETLFLQDRKRSSDSKVTIDAIYRGPLKRHRASLKKLMLDSSDRIPRGPASPDNTRWRAWMPNRDVLNFITSGRMSSLRELSIAIDYKDWHHFLQRLPQIPHLRSLNIPYIADHATPVFDPRELAMQVVDVIVLRPEVELCYMGVSHKCFEILENRSRDDSHGSTDTHSSAANGGADVVTDDEGTDEDASDEEDEDEDAEEEDNGPAIALDPDETESEISDHDDSDTDSFTGSEDGRSKVRLRLREILFYDDKVAIFKARHGKL